MVNKLIIYKIIIYIYKKKFNFKLKMLKLYKLLVNFKLKLY